MGGEVHAAVVANDVNQLKELMMREGVRDPNQLAAASQILEDVKEFIANTNFSPPVDGAGNLDMRKY